jgi:signal transduction histidine kinase
MARQGRRAERRPLSPGRRQVSDAPREPLAMKASAPSRGADTGAGWALKPLGLWAIGVAGCAAAAFSVWLAFESDHLAEPGLRAALLDWITLPYVLAGLVAWWRRPHSRFGPLMVAAGFVMFLSSFQWANEPFPYTIGLAFDLLPPALFLHVYLAFPSGRLQRRLERIAVAAAYSAAVGLQFVKMLLGGVGPDNLLAVVTAPAAANTVQDVQLITLSALCLLGIALLAARRRAARRPLRRSVGLLVDSFVLGLVAIAVLLVAGAFELPAFETIRRITFGIIGIAPVAFLIGLLDARLARSAVGELVVELRADPAPADLPEAFARALRDPSLTLAYWVPQFESWADSDGKPVELPNPESGRATTFIDRDGAHVAALLHDRSLDDERELLDAVSAAAGIALENGRLHAELRAGLEELKGSRGRVIEAGRKERQRLERNLHDGAQQRLIALSLDLRRLEERLHSNPEAKAGLDRARREIALSLEELRGVARGIHPAVVTGHGLAVALESLAAHAAVPVRLTVEIGGRVHERIEVAAYYVVCESLANIGKHAGATSASVEVARKNGEIVVEVVDDGVGGADSERGTGLRGLADRVEALDGRLRVWTPRGGGTRVRAEMPCG